MIRSKWWCECRGCTCLPMPAGIDEETSRASIIELYDKNDEPTIRWVL